MIVGLLFAGVAEVAAAELQRLHSRPVPVRVKRTLGDGHDILAHGPLRYTVEGSRWLATGLKRVHVG